MSHSTTDAKSEAKDVSWKNQGKPAQAAVAQPDARVSALTEHQKPAVAPENSRFDGRHNAAGQELRNVQPHPDLGGRTAERPMPPKPFLEQAAMAVNPSPALTESERIARLEKRVNEYTKATGRDLLGPQPDQSGLEQDADKREAIQEERKKANGLSPDAYR